MNGSAVAHYNIIILPAADQIVRRLSSAVIVIISYYVVDTTFDCVRRSYGLVFYNYNYCCCYSLGRPAGNDNRSPRTDEQECRHGRVCQPFRVPGKTYFAHAAGSSKILFNGK